MRITCPDCRSEYAFDPDRISGGGTKVKCSACSHVFTVFHPEGARNDGDEVRRLDADATGGPGLFFRQEGKTYPVRDLSVLQRWIVEKRVLATDQVSVDGESWERVRRVAELRPFFDLIRLLRETRRELQYTRDRLRGYVTGEHRQASGDESGDESGDAGGDDEPEIHATREVMQHVEGGREEKLVHLAHPTATPDPEDLVEPESAEFRAAPSSGGYSEVVDSGTGDSSGEFGESDEIASLEHRIVGSSSGEVAPDGGDTASMALTGELEPNTAEMVTAESPEVVSAQAPTEAELQEALTGDGLQGPIPRAAKETMSRLAAQ
ncbi:MAG: zinc-ribbon domain-containing protein, partial [Myxococcota bacterium]|nr:zinc-ribbon domain-containing protein [Myxococcota bacterium]